MELFAILFFYSITQFSDYFIIIIIIIIFTSQIITVRLRFFKHAKLSPSFHPAPELYISLGVKMPQAPE